jgi:hypothetical protein
LRLGREVQQLDALAGEGVDAGGVGTPEHPAAVTAQFTEAQIVDVKIDNVRWLLHRTPSFLAHASAAGFFWDRFGFA